MAASSGSRCAAVPGSASRCSMPISARGPPNSDATRPLRSMAECPVDATTHEDARVVRDPLEETRAQRRVADRVGVRFSRPSNEREAGLEPRLDLQTLGLAQRAGGRRLELLLGL